MMKKSFNIFLFAISLTLMACSGFESGGRGGNAPTNVTPPGWVTITGPAENTQSQLGVLLTGTCDPELVIDLSGDGLQSPTTTVCDGGTFTVPVTFTAGDGNKNIIAAQTDGSGVTASDSRIFVRDTTAPNLSITAPGVNANISPTFTLSGTCETGLVVFISGAGNQTASSTACSGGNFSATVTATAGDGTKNFVITQTDTAGNSGSSNRNFIRSSAAPVVAITQPATNTSTTAGVTLQGTCVTGLTVNLSGTGLQSPNTTTCTGGAFSVAITLSPIDGLKTIMVAQTNAEGITGSDTRTFIKNNTPFPWKCGSTVDVTWVAPTQNTDGSTLVDLAGFKIYYGAATGAYSTVLDITNPAATTRTISGLAPGGIYLAMTAYNASNVESDRTGEAGVLLVDCMTTTVDLLTGKVTYRPYPETTETIKED